MSQLELCISVFHRKSDFELRIKAFQRPYSKTSQIQTQEPTTQPRDARSEPRDARAQRRLC